MYKRQVSQIFDAFVEISNLFLIISDILDKFSNFTFILEFMLLTRFDWAVEAMNVLSKVIFLDWAVAEAVNVLVAVAVAVAVAEAEAVNVPTIVPPVVSRSSDILRNSSFLVSRIVPVGGYEIKGKWMSLFRDMIFCVFLY